jgi:nicotinate-nucleotide pyrophosphorylase (carboxylating)
VKGGIDIDSGVLGLIRTAIEEDVGPGDVTTESVVPEGHASRGSIVSRAEGVVAGLDVAAAVFSEIDPGVSFVALVSDGARVSPGDVVATVEGTTRGILTGERVALNFLQRLSGIATAAAACVKALEGTPTRVLDTRKTTPGMRALEKYAVRAGGGQNHRSGLYDMILIKDNHIAAAGGIGPAVNAARAAHPELGLEVEAGTLDEVAAALEAGADRIMLDNMTLDDMREAIALARRGGQSAEIEISGGFTPEGLRTLAELGADYVSVGALTHSVRALDLSLELEPGRQSRSGRRSDRT